MTTRWLPPTCLWGGQGVTSMISIAWLQVLSCQECQQICQQPKRNVAVTWTCNCAFMIIVEVQVQVLKETEDENWTLRSWTFIFNQEKIYPSIPTNWCIQTEVKSNQTKKIEMILLQLHFGSFVMKLSSSGNLQWRRQMRRKVKNVFFHIFIWQHGLTGASQTPQTHWTGRKVM